MADVESLELQITGDARSAEQSINSLISTLERLNKATAGGCGLNAVANGMGKVSSAGSRTASVNNKSAASFTNLAAKIAVAYHALGKVGKVISSWINESNEYTENVNLFSVAMGKYAESAMDYATKVSDVMGIDPSDWIRSQGVFMTLATGFGVAGDRANLMSQQLTQLGYDLSSFYNISVEEAMQKLKSGFAGELEPLRNLGYDLSQAKLQAIALSLGIDKTVASMTQAEKSELRYYAIMTQVTQAQGDMARTLSAPANQLRILQAQVTQAARAFGNLFIPVLNAVLPVVIAVVKVITMLAQAIASLFGISLEVDFSGASAGAADLGASVGDVSDGLGGASKKAKDLKKILLGIDELNVLPDASSGGGGGGAGGVGGGGFDFDLPTYDFIGDATNERINAIVEKIKDWLGLTEEINSVADFLDTRLGRILSLVGLIGTGFALWKLSNGFLSALDAVKKLLANPAQSIAIGATLALTGFTISFAGMKEAIQDGLDGFNFAEIIGGGLLGAGGAAILGSTIANWITTAFAGSAIDLAITQAGINLGVGTAGAAGAAILSSIAAVIVGIPAYFVGIYDAVKNGIDWLNSVLIGAGAAAAGAGIGAIIGMLGGPIGAGIGALIGLAVGLVTDGIILLVQNWDAVSAWFTQAFATVGQFFSGLWSDIQGIWSQVATWFDTNVIQPALSLFSDLWPVISDLASECWEAIVDYFSPAVDWFTQLFSSIYETISDIFYNIGVIASGCWEIIRVLWSAASGFFTNLWNGIKTGATNLWNGIKTTAINAWNGIKTALSPFADWINTNIVQPASTLLSGLWNGFLTGAKNAWEGTKQVFSAVATFFHNTFKAAWEGIVKIFSVAGSIFVDIKNGIVSAFKSIVNGLIRGINNVVAVPFRHINTALSTIRNISIMGLSPFSGLRSISVPSIPYLASGGVLDAGQLFVAREAGPELVANAGRKTAVMNNDQIVESVSQGVYRAFIQAMAESGSNQVVEAKVNDKVLFEVIVGRNRQETMRTGRSPLLGGV